MGKNKSLDEILEIMESDLHFHEYSQKIKDNQIKFDSQNIEKSMHKNLPRSVNSYDKSYHRHNLKLNKYGSIKDSTIYNNQIYRLLMDHLKEDTCIYHMILKDSPNFPEEKLKSDSYLNQEEDTYLVLTEHNTGNILGTFNLTAYRLWVDHLGLKSSYKKYPNTYLRIIKKSKHHFKVILSRKRPILEIRSDNIISYSKENKL